MEYDAGRNGRVTIEDMTLDDLRLWQSWRTKPGFTATIKVYRIRFRFSSSRNT